MTNIEIRKGKGIEGLVRANQVEEVREVEVGPGLYEAFWSLFE